MGHAAVRALRAPRAKDPRDRASRLGEAADRVGPRLCRAALHLRRSRPPCAAGRHRLSHSFGRLSCPDPQHRRGVARLPLVALVRLFPLGRLAAGKAANSHLGDRAAAEGVGRAGAFAGRARPPLAAHRAAQGLFRHRRWRVRRGKGARALRASLRGRPRHRGRARRQSRGGAMATKRALPSLV